MSKNVLIVSHSFPPLNNIAARRFGFLAPHLARHGWTPWVITTESEGPLPVGIPERQIIRVGRHPQSTARIESPSGGHGRQLSPPIRLARKMLARAKLQLRAVDYTCLGWRREVVEKSDDIVRRLPTIDAVLGTFGPAASIWIARHFSKKLSAPWVADYRDLAALRHDGRPLAARHVDRLIERRILNGAAAVTSTGRTWADILNKAYKIPAEVIYNGWDPEVFASGEETDFVPPRGRYLHYAGRFYPERMRAASVVLETIALEANLKLLIRSLGPPDLEKAFLDEARRLGVMNRVHVLQPCSPALVAAEADRAVANLVLDDVADTYESSRGVLTGKFLELVARKRPVLAVTQPDSEMGPILSATKKGRVCTTVADVRGFLRDIDAGLQPAEGDAARIDRYSKASQAAVLANLLDSLIERENPAATGPFVFRGPRSRYKQRPSGDRCKV